MHPARWSGIALLGSLLALLAGCAPGPGPAAPSPTAPGQTADQVAAAFFGAWERAAYDAMYDLLADAARASVTRDAFAQRYATIHQGIGEAELSVQAQPAAGAGGTARVPFQVTRRVALFGSIAESNELPLVQEQGAWRVAWQPGLIFAGLSESSKVRFDTDAPRRGRVLDRHATPLAEDGAVLAVGVIPGQVTDEARLAQAVGDALGLDPAVVKQRSRGGQPDWFMPLATRPASDRPALEQSIGSIPGVSLQDRPGRVYPLGEAAAHVVGYLGHPTADELKRLAAAGYDESDWIGRSGLEAWGEQYLAGQKGGRLAIVGQDGQPLRLIAERGAVPGQDLHLALDAALQTRAAQVLGDRAGSVVVLDPRDNGLLAIASQPSFDPSAFILGLTDAEWQALNGEARPLLFRAASSAYPTGSIFKVVTMAAGLERGGFTPADTFDCASDWHGLPGVTLHNWEPQGVLDLVEALTESCNPAFYTIGLKLDQIDPNLLPSFARAFGLGEPTGAGGLAEATGSVPDPKWKQEQLGQPWVAGDSVNLAIGQGNLLATPLQMANAYAALAAGGALRTPLLVTSVAGGPAFAAQEKGTLPLSAPSRAAILEGMRRVTSTRRGTASYAFSDEPTPTAAKTGSAENENPDAHAWFAGFMTPDQPTVLALVMIEGGQHGGTVAAPLAREILDAAYPLTR